MELDAGGLEILSREDCLALMRTAQIGRVVFTDRALPAIQPVNFALDGDDVVIVTAPGSKLAAATRGSIVAFEVDDFDAVTRTGWSVTVVGQARALRGAGAAERPFHLPLATWAPGQREYYIRIRTHHISGRRIVPAVGLESA